MKNIRKCYTCGAEYDYCPTCSGNKGEQWHLLWDKDECRDIFKALCAYNLGFSDDTEVKKVLNDYEVKSYDKYTPVIRKQLQKIAPISGQKSVDIDSKKEKE